ncbi:vWA domain-containing protein [Coralliovum pocilloporae]|uniref:vWA domain-containing protein n=1 Tax=Coralliovum pocilloporae TaxID=3066369 RepID=UPI0033076969
MTKTILKTALMTTAALAVGAGLTMSAQARAADGNENIILVLDASGSMWGQIDGKAKIEIARETISDVLGNIPQDRAVGLMAYGHRHKNQCDDIELVMPPQKNIGAAIRNEVNAIKPKGKTPLTLAVREAANHLGYEDKAATVVLVTDGLETCNQDPCALGHELEKSGTNFTTHVIGFGLSEEEGKQVSCLADNTGGQYLAAADASTLSDALNATVVAAAEPAPQPEPEPVRPAAKSVFLDEFEGEALGEHWVVINEDQDNYVVDNGELILVNSGRSGLREQNSKNIVQWQSKPPRGDWDMTMTGTFDMATGRDSGWVGLYEDKDNFIAAHLWTNTGHCSAVGVSIIKRVKGEESSFQANILGSGCGWGNASKADVNKLLGDLAENPSAVTLSKRGRKYFANFKQDTFDVSTEELTLIRSKGKPTLAMGQWDGRKGDTTGIVDRFEIKSQK